MENNMELPQLTLAQQAELLKDTEYGPKKLNDKWPNATTYAKGTWSLQLIERDAKLNAARAILLARRVSELEERITQLESGDVAALRAALEKLVQHSKGLAQQVNAMGYSTTIYNPVQEAEYALAATPAPDAGWQDISTAPRSHNDQVLVGFWDYDSFAKPEWITFVACYQRVDFNEGAGEDCRKGWMPVGNGGDGLEYEIHPTHWQPLPAPAEPAGDMGGADE